MRSMKLLGGILSLCVLSQLEGCASYTGETFVRVDPPVSSKASVYIYSAETGCFDLGQMNTEVLVNGEKFLTLAENNYTLITLPEGNYRFESSSDDQNVCHGRLLPGRYWPPVNLKLKASHIYFLQYNPRADHCISTCDRHLVEVDAELANDEMQGANRVQIRRGK